MLRVCVIGMGPIGNRHADIYKSDALAKLVGVCDLQRERAEKAAARLGVPGFTDASEMLKSVEPDVCSITTGGYEYGSDHFAPTMLALDAGCHVLGEKPISNDIAQAAQMVEKARANKRCYGINLNHRFTPAARVARRWMDEGKLGSLLFINMSMWIKNPTESSPYFQIKALHPHTVDVMRHFCGDVESVQCFATKAPGRKIWSTAHFSMQFKNGVVGGLTGSYDIERGHPMERCEVAGTKGRFVLDDLWREATLYPAGNLEKTVYTNPVFGGFLDFEQTFKERIHIFMDQVANVVPPEKIDASGADVLEAQRVLAAAIVSLNTGTVVKVAEVTA